MGILMRKEETNGEKETFQLPDEHLIGVTERAIHIKADESDTGKLQGHGKLERRFAIDQRLIDN